jgi:hypothetical protein
MLTLKNLEDCKHGALAHQPSIYHFHSANYNCCCRENLCFCFLEDYGHFCHDLFAANIILLMCFHIKDSKCWRQRLVCSHCLFGIYLFRRLLSISLSRLVPPYIPIFSYLFHISVLFWNLLFAFSLIIIGLSSFFHAWQNLCWIFHFHEENDSMLDQVH